MTVDIPADLPLIMADAPLMEQVITNLLHNAALYTPAGSPLTIATSASPWLSPAVENRSIYLSQSKLFLPDSDCNNSHPRYCGSGGCVFIDWGLPNPLKYVKVHSWTKKAS